MQNNLAVTMLGALALDARLRVVSLLSQAGKDGLAAGEIARQLGLQPNTLSGHLTKLSQAKILVSERRKTSIIYRLNEKSIRDLKMFLNSF